MLHNGPHAADPSYDLNSFHIHADLAIYVDSQLVTIPAGVGNPSSGSAQIHTHDNSGRIHIHPATPQADFITVADVFDSWANNPRPAGSPTNITLSDTQIFDNVVSNTHTLQMFVNGIEVDEEFADYQIHDLDNIVLVYTSNPVITLNTNAGSIPLELLRDEAPNTVTNYLRYVNGGVDGQGFTGTVLHRSDPNFVIQGGGFRPTSLTTTNLNEIQGPFNSQTGNFQHHIPAFAPIPDERGAGSTSNVFGTVAMAKNSAGATSEFFFNFGNNAFLDTQGFTVFAIALGMTTPSGTRVETATINRIDGFTRVDVDPSNDSSGAFSVFDNVPYTAQGQMVAIQSIGGQGVVRGVVFGDTDRDGVLDTNEVGLAGRTVFSDANNNGSLDANEVSAVTDATGVYVLRLDPGQHTIRQVLASGTVLTAPTNPASFSIDVAIGSDNADVRFGNATVSAPGVPDLLAATDSGNTTDNITNFDNGSAAKALQFQVPGVLSGAIVRLFAGGTLIGQATASGTSVTITTDGSNALPQGTNSIVATQEVAGLQGPASTGLSITIDSHVPAAFTSVPPTTVIFDNDLAYNAEHPEEAGGTITYALRNAPTGATINATTGVVQWFPTEQQVGVRDFDVVATDTAGNEAVQNVSVNVTRQPIVAATFKLTATNDPNAAAITEVTVGDMFFLHVSVADLRSNANGIFAFHEDILFDDLLATANEIVYDDQFDVARSGFLPGQVISPGVTSPDGVVNEIGSLRDSLSGLGAGSFRMFSVKFTADRSGTLQLVGTSPDESPAHDTLVFGLINGQTTPIPTDQIIFGSTQLTINPTFGANDDIFNFDEDSQNNTLNVLANDSTLSGGTGNLTITGVTPEITGLSIASDGKSLLYTPPADFHGSVTFDYTVTDGADTLTANVIVEVHPINDHPVAVDDTFDVNPGTNNNFLDVLANDTDVDGNPDVNGNRLRVLRIDSVSGSGTATRASSGTGIQYTPGAGFRGQELIVYTVTDGTLTSQATVTVTVAGAGDDRFDVDEGSQNTTFDVLANDIGQGLTITAVGQRSNGGIVTIGTGGTNLIYSRPQNDNFFGTDTFTYTAVDNQNRTSVGTVIVTVKNTNDPPTAVNDTLTVRELSTNNELNVLANDTNAPDPAGTETLTVVAVNNTGTHGTVSLVNGKVMYTPPATFPATNASTGTDTFTYTIDDGSGLTSTATVTVNVVEFVPGSLSGFVYFDADNDGVRDPGETPVQGVQITLTGTDDFGQTVSRQATTGTDGSYSFNGLAPGSYTINQTQPTGQHNGLPIVDGKDTIGSQGGTVSANDQFTITLAEGVSGTGNNFGELLGRSISGTVFHDANGDQALFNVGIDGRFGGLEISLLQGSVTARSLSVTSAGTFQVDGLPPDLEYTISLQTPTFLKQTSPRVTMLSATADSTVNPVTISGRQAKYISLRDISNAAPSQFLQASVGATGTQWYLLGPGWDDFSSANLSMMPNGTLHLEVTNSGNQRLMTDLTPSQYRRLGQEGELQLVQINSGSAALNLQPVPANGSGEGEAEHHESGHTQHSQPAAAATTSGLAVSTSHAHDGGESSGHHDHGDHSGHHDHGDHSGHHDHGDHHSELTSSLDSAVSAARIDAEGSREVLVHQPVLARPVPVVVTPSSTTLTASNLLASDIEDLVQATTVSSTFDVHVPETDDHSADRSSLPVHDAALLEVTANYDDELGYGASLDSMHEDDEEEAEQAVDEVMEEETVLELLSEFIA